MRSTLTVFRREVRSYFLSPIAYVVGVLFLSVQLWFSGQSILRPGGIARMDPFFRQLSLMLMVFVPALTMRSWAEERKVGTLELLMTFPVRVHELVLGKFLASLAFLGVLLLLTLGLPLILAGHGRLDWGPVFAAYLASMLLAGGYLAVGMFWSAMTRDQIVALLLAVVSLFLLAALSVFRLVFEGWGVPVLLLDILGELSPTTHFVSISRGVVDSRDLVYYLTLSSVFLYLNGLVLHARRHRG